MSAAPKISTTQTRTLWPTLCSLLANDVERPVSALGCLCRGAEPTVERGSAVGQCPLPPQFGRRCGQNTGRTRVPPGACLPRDGAWRRGVACAWWTRRQATPALRCTTQGVACSAGDASGTGGGHRGCRWLRSASPGAGRGGAASYPRRRVSRVCFVCPPSPGALKLELGDLGGGGRASGRFQRYSATARGCRNSKGRRETIPRGRCCRSNSDARQAAALSSVEGAHPRYAPRSGMVASQSNCKRARPFRSVPH